MRKIAKATGGKTISRCLFSDSLVLHYSHKHLKKKGWNYLALEMQCVWLRFQAV